MSSMRNAVQRRNHRERGQPEERAKWGLLEKHKVWQFTLLINIPDAKSSSGLLPSGPRPQCEESQAALPQAEGA
ncbi:MAG: hypothetical protein H9W83_12295 [Leuconostoc sp.]|nr:hypothetical protein [Leuconostoc sp.]